MKRIVFFILFLFFDIINSLGQHSILVFPGGTISSTVNWTTYDTIYITGSVTVNSSGILNIGPNTSGSDIGTYVIFNGASFGITVNSGVLNVNGTLSENIYFTADWPTSGFSHGNKNFNEGETWRDIAILSNTTSLINYAIIEHGTGYITSNQGGGIYINGRNVTIRNSTINNCTCTSSGGGIYALASGTPGGITLENLIIHDNTCGSTGGGMFLAGNGVFVSVSGCKIYNNVSTGVGAGIYNNNMSSTRTIVNTLIYNHSSGYGIYSVAPNSNIVNSIIGNNTHGIFSGASTSPVITNTIVWGNSSSQLSGTGTPVVTYCGIQGGYSGTGNVNLNSDNDNATGPNFINSGSDSSLKYISPLRDAGTSIGTPTTDILGKGRVLNYDIGAYELQYSKWTGAISTAWNIPENWVASVDPGTGSGDVIIPSGLSNYPNVPTTQDFTINPKKVMILEAGTQVTLNDLKNNGTLDLRSDASGISSLIVNSYTHSGGTENIQLYLTGGASTLWHYISLPVSSVSTTLFSSQTRSLVRYEENYITNDWNNGWVSYEGLHYNPTANQWQTGGTAWTTLDAGRGYNYNSTDNKTFTISGQINTNDIPINLNYASGGAGTPADQGYNLIGNPFTSAIDWDLVRTSTLNTSQLHWSKVEQAIYFRSNGALYVYNGITVPGGTDPGDKDGRYLAPLQGCFIKSDTNNFTLYLPTAAKVHSANPRFKGANTIPLVRLQIDNSGKSDQTVVRFDKKATLIFDNEFDARKIYQSSDILSISSSLSGTEYTINGIPFPESSITFPILLRAPNSGTYTITAKELTGLESYKVVLTDKYQNSATNLSDVGTYSFTSSSGKYDDRFVLTISNINTVVPENATSKTAFSIYSGTGMINIQTVSDTWNGIMGDIKIFDITGKLMVIVKNTEFNAGDLKQIPAGFKTGVYIVEITAVGKRYVGKVVIR